MHELATPPVWHRNGDALPGLTVVLPCLDEAENLPDAVGCAVEAAGWCAEAFEVVVVDDGSSDPSAVVARRLAARDARVRVVVHGEHRGYGAAVRSGLAAARMPWVLVLDADLQFDVGELREFLGQAGSADLLIGRRRVTQGPVIRRAGNALWNRVLRAALHLPVHDAECGFRLIRTELAGRLDLRAAGPLVGAELVVRCRAAGARVAEVPVRHRVRVAGRGTGVGARVSARTVRELFELRRWRGSWR